MPLDGVLERGGLSCGIKMAFIFTSRNRVFDPSIRSSIRVVQASLGALSMRNISATPYPILLLLRISFQSSSHLAIDVGTDSKDEAIIA